MVSIVAEVSLQICSDLHYFFFTVQWLHLYKTFLQMVYSITSSYYPLYVGVRLNRKPTLVKHILCNMAYTSNYNTLAVSWYFYFSKIWRNLSVHLLSQSELVNNVTVNLKCVTKCRNQMCGGYIIHWVRTELLCWFYHLSDQHSLYECAAFLLARAVVICQICDFV